METPSLYKVVKESLKNIGIEPDDKVNAIINKLKEVAKSEDLWVEFFLKLNILEKEIAKNYFEYILKNPPTKIAHISVKLDKYFEKQMNVTSSDFEEFKRISGGIWNLATRYLPLFEAYRKADPKKRKKIVKFLESFNERNRKTLLSQIGWIMNEIEENVFESDEIKEKLEKFVEKLPEDLYQFFYEMYRFPEIWDFTLNFYNELIEKDKEKGQIEKRIKNFLTKYKIIASYLKSRIPKGTLTWLAKESIRYTPETIRDLLSTYENIIKKLDLGESIGKKKMKTLMSLLENLKMVEETLRYTEKAYGIKAPDFEGKTPAEAKRELENFMKSHEKEIKRIKEIIENEKWKLKWISEIGMEETENLTKINPYKENQGYKAYIKDFENYSIIIDPKNIALQMEALSYITSCLSPDQRSENFQKYTLKYLPHPDVFFGVVKNKRGRVIGRFTLMAPKIKGKDKKVLIVTSKIYGSENIKWEDIYMAAEDFAKINGMEFLPPEVAEKYQYMIEGLPDIYDDYIDYKGEKIPEERELIFGYTWEVEKNKKH